MCSKSIFLAFFFFGTIQIGWSLEVNIKMQFFDAPFDQSSSKPILELNGDHVDGFVINNDHEGTVVLNKIGLSHVNVLRRDSLVVIVTLNNMKCKSAAISSEKTKVTFDGKGFQMKDEEKCVLTRSYNHLFTIHLEGQGIVWRGNDSVFSFNKVPMVEGRDINRVIIEKGFLCIELNKSLSGSLALNKTICVCVNSRPIVISRVVYDIDTEIMIPVNARQSLEINKALKSMEKPK